MISAFDKKLELAEDVGVFLFEDAAREQHTIFCVVVLSASERYKDASDNNRTCGAYVCVESLDMPVIVTRSRSLSGA
jgi:hypothetical protein